MTDYNELDEYGMPIEGGGSLGSNGATVLRSEFSIIEVSRDDDANGARLRIYAPETGDFVYLDPLELEALTRMTHRELVRAIPPPTADLGRI